MNYSKVYENVVLITLVALVCTVKPISSALIENPKKLLEECTSRGENILKNIAEEEKGQLAQFIMRNEPYASFILGTIKKPLVTKELNIDYDYRLNVDKTKLAFLELDKPVTLCMIDIPKGSRFTYTFDTHWSSFDKKDFSFEWVANSDCLVLKEFFNFIVIDTVNGDISELPRAHNLLVRKDRAFAIEENKILFIDLKSKAITHTFDLGEPQCPLRYKQWISDTQILIFNENYHLKIIDSNTGKLVSDIYLDDFKAWAATLPQALQLADPSNILRLRPIVSTKVKDQKLILYCSWDFEKKRWLEHTELSEKFWDYAKKTMPTKIIVFDLTNNTVINTVKIELGDDYQNLNSFEYLNSNRSLKWKGKTVELIDNLTKNARVIIDYPETIREIIANDDGTKILVLYYYDHSLSRLIDTQTGHIISKFTHDNKFDIDTVEWNNNKIAIRASKFQRHQLTLINSQTGKVIRSIASTNYPTLSPDFSRVALREDEQVKIIDIAADKIVGAVSFKKLGKEFIKDTHYEVIWDKYNLPIILCRAKKEQCDLALIRTPSMTEDQIIALAQIYHILNSLHPSDLLLALHKELFNVVRQDTNLKRSLLVP